MTILHNQLDEDNVELSNQMQAILVMFFTHFWVLPIPKVMSDIVYDRDSFVTVGA